MTNALPSGLDRTALYAVLDSYLAALKARDPSRVSWGETVRNSENNVALMLGDGLWNTITDLGPYDLRFADPLTGQVGLFTTVTETDDLSACSLRLGVDRKGRIVEVETIVVRQLDSGIRFEPQAFERKPVMEEIVPPSARVSRERMIALADGYFSTLERNDGTILTRIHPECNRIENGLQTTNNPEFFTSVAHLGCEDQLRLGNYIYDDRLRARHYPLVDEERGLVLATAFIDHSGRIGDYTLTDGTKVTSPLRRPHSFYMLELFKIRHGMIEQIEANFITVPYHMPTPWDAWR
ncbi:hypothetical protein D2V17_19650 [Aurantiacibacter xanthus]|uniref:DUF8021 domain-containing protein n=1 Tax=Aurantiacibacter xanthus TaxID=1784712 RepID=A0A3A1NZR1_9SPHN|nr:hypothetical protein [Aurantiacibacter xanthus]RIV80071.1 hypothetical protein D2V17_19650 [Aurantiacibacter xanthus]